MEENLHGDKLDDYVRRSFEGFEESPPADMWERVDVAMGDTSVRPALRKSFGRRGWQLLAAGIILVLSSTLICEHLAYEDKIRELSQTLNRPSQIPLASEPEADDKSSGVSGLSENGYATTRVDPGKTQTDNIYSKGPMTSPNQPDILPSPKNSPPLTDWIEHPPVLPKEAQLLTLAEVPSDNNPESVAPSMLAEILIPVEIRSVPVFPGKLDWPESGLPELKTRENGPKPIVRPVQNVSGWYVGVENSFLFPLGKTQALPSRPGKPAFANQTAARSNTHIAWLKVGKQWNNGWSLETGLGYQHWTNTSVHYPRFRFGDGTQVGPPMGHRRIFTYDVNTTSGTAEVSLRMEQTQSGNLPDDEPVPLRVETTESSDWIRVPLLLGYRWGEHRWRGSARAGILGNVVFKNHLDITARVSENSRFMPVEGQDGYNIVLTQKRFIPAYWAGLGTEYQLGRHLQIKAEASFSADFPRNDAHRRRLPERYLAGVNLGLRYYF